MRCRLSLATSLFLSTPSARRATGCFISFWCLSEISIHALREEGDYHNRADDCRAGQFLSTPSARRATPCPCTPLCSQNKFLSTPSARRATSSALHFAGRRAISIHALREEGDGTHSVNDSKSADFYPRPPRGGRHERNGNFEEAKEFLSTPSARRATGGAVRLCMRSGISIHALREEGDMGLIPPFCTMSHFYPRPPRGGRRRAAKISAFRVLFLSTPSARRATVVVDERDLREVISIHALREEGDEVFILPKMRVSYFYPRPPRGGRP